MTDKTTNEVKSDSEIDYVEESFQIFYPDLTYTAADSIREYDFFVILNKINLLENEITIERVPIFIEEVSNLSELYEKPLRDIIFPVNIPVVYSVDLGTKNNQQLTTRMTPIFLFTDTQLIKKIRKKFEENVMKKLSLFKVSIKNTEELILKYVLFYELPVAEINNFLNWLLLSASPKFYRDFLEDVENTIISVISNKDESITNSSTDFVIFNAFSNLLSKVSCLKKLATTNVQFKEDKEEKNDKSKFNLLDSKNNEFDEKHLLLKVKLNELLKNFIINGKTRVKRVIFLILLQVMDDERFKYMRQAILNLLDSIVSDDEVTEVAQDKIIFNLKISRNEKTEKHADKLKELLEKELIIKNNKTNKVINVSFFNTTNRDSTIIDNKSEDTLDTLVFVILQDYHKLFLDRILLGDIIPSKHRPYIHDNSVFFIIVPETNFGINRPKENEKNGNNKEIKRHLLMYGNFLLSSEKRIKEDLTLFEIPVFKVELGGC